MKEWKFGLIGCGSVADFHIEAIRDLDRARLTYVASRSAEKARSVAEREGCAWTNDYRELLASPEVDIVCVTTSSGSHARIGMDVVRAGKHLVVEKPIAMNSQDAAELIQAAKDSGVLLSVISQRRFEPQHLAVKRLLEQGGLGKLLLVEVSLPFYRSQSYYDSAEWRGTLAEDGGALMNQGIHNLDLMLWFAGDIHSVFGTIATQTHQMEAEDLGLAIVRFAGGAFGTIMASTSIRPGFPAALNLYGERGTIKLEGSSIALWSVPGLRQPDVTPPASYGGVSDPRSISSVYHREQLADVIRAIETGGEPLVTGEDGKRAVELVEAIYESASKGIRLILNPGVDRFAAEPGR